MSRNFFKCTAAVSLLISAAAFIIIYKQLIDIPEKYEIPAITLIPVFALTAVICFFIQLAIRDHNDKKYRLEHPEEGRAMRQEMIEEASMKADTQTMYKLQLLREKLAGIIGRVIATIIVITVFGDRSPVACITTYITVSYCWIFIKATGNFIIGIGGFLICLLYATDKFLEKFSDKNQELIMNALLIGVFVIDAINIIRYIAIRIKIANSNLKIRKLTREEMQQYKKRK